MAFSQNLFHPIGNFACMHVRLLFDDRDDI